MPKHLVSVTHKRTFFFLLTIGVIHCAFGQKLTNLPQRSIQISGGYNRHGSGDLPGVGYGAEYVKYFSKGFSLNINLRGTINSDVHKFTVTDANGYKEDNSLRFTTAGVQLGTDAGFSFLRTQRHELMVTLGAFVRYQSESGSIWGYSYYLPDRTALPAVVLRFMGGATRNTVAPGATLRFQYNLSLSRKVYFGLVPSIQTDTNGDLIWQAGAALGRRF